MALQFELTNFQRKYLGLDLVEDTWDIVQINEEVFLYFDNDIIRKRIKVTNNSYHECEMNEATESNRTILLPKTSKGKVQKLNFTSIDQRNGHGVYFYFGSNGIRIANYTTQTTFFSTTGDKRSYKSFQDLTTWIDQWIKDTTEQDLADLESFKKSERKHINYKEGDFFAFKIGRREYGFGRILLDIGKLRKNQDFVNGKNYGILNFMGKPLIVKVYHMISNTPSVEINELMNCNAFPSQPIMDNAFYYGEYAIIGNRKLAPEELDFPISYSKSIDFRDKTTVYLQYGLIYRETDLSKFNKHLTGKVIKTSENHQYQEANPYSNIGIGFGLDILLNIGTMKKCIEEKSNQPYWDSDIYTVKHDLRNPALAAIKQELFQYFGLDPNVGYSENVAKH